MSRFDVHLTAVALLLLLLQGTAKAQPPFELQHLHDIPSLRLLSRFVPSIKFPDRKPDPRKYNARGMAVRGGIVYLAYDAGGLRILDARNKAKPVEIGRYSNPAMDSKPRAYNNVVVDGTLAYVTVDYCGLEVLDVSKPSAVKRVSWWNPWKCDASPWNWFTSPGHTNEIAYDPQCGLLFLSSGATQGLTRNSRRHPR
jgi:hypothetical protein